VNTSVIVHGTFKSEQCVNILKENTNEGHILKISDDNIFSKTARLSAMF